MGDTFHEAPGPRPPEIAVEAVRLPAPASPDHAAPARSLAVAHGDLQQALRTAEAPQWVLVLVDDVMHRHRADAEREPS